MPCSDNFTTAVFNDMPTGPDNFLLSGGAITTADSLYWEIYENGSVIDSGTITGVSGTTATVYTTNVLHVTTSLYLFRWQKNCADGSHTGFNTYWFGFGAYNKKYQIRFKNRIQNDIYRCEIWQKNFSGTTKDLPGGETPFTANWQETEILAPIKSCEFTINFIADNTISIEDFYSDDDEGFRIDFYFESLADGSGTEKLLHTGYLIQDGASEPVTDRKHTITLKATDNLALLKNVLWNQIEINTPGIKYNSKLALINFIFYSLKETGLYSSDTTIQQNLPLRIYDNLFENTTADRSVSVTNDPFQETVLNAAMFQNTDNTWDNCYSILEKILTDLNAGLFQAEGCWNITRPNEYQYFDGSIPGTEYIYPDSVNALTLDTSAAIARGGGDCYPVAEDQQKSILRPYRYILNTFNYNSPPFIKQADLKLPKGATPYSTSTTGGLRTDKYHLSYFPDWVQRNTAIDIHLEIVTDTATNTEKDRYIYVQGVGSQRGGVQFNSIDINKGDEITISTSVKTLGGGSGSTAAFWMRADLLLPDGTFYMMARYLNATDHTISVIRWMGPYPANTWDSTWHDNTTPLGDVSTYSYFEYQADGTYQTITNTDGNITYTGGSLPAPADGILLLQFNGTNNDAPGATVSRFHSCFKDISVTLKNRINNSTSLSGQTHQDTGTSTIKATSVNDIVMDDSPRNAIAGTLFTDATTNFNFTDIVTGEHTGITDEYFTRTALWHRSDIPEALRLGNIITQERIDLRYNSKLIVEGTFRNLRYQANKFISMLSMFQVDFYGDRNFLPASMNINYMDSSFQTKLIEVFKNSGGAFVDEYDFEYLYKTD